MPRGTFPSMLMQFIDFARNTFRPLKRWPIRGYEMVTGGLHRVHVVTRGRQVFNKTRDQVQPLKESRKRGKVCPRQPGQNKHAATRKEK
jgi:hypothetical protein